MRTRAKRSTRWEIRLRWFKIAGMLYSFPGGVPSTMVAAGWRFKLKGSARGRICHQRHVGHRQKPKSRDHVNPAGISCQARPNCFLSLVSSPHYGSVGIPSANPSISLFLTARLLKPRSSKSLRRPNRRKATPSCQRLPSTAYMRSISIPKHLLATLMQYTTELRAI